MSVPVEASAPRSCLAREGDALAYRCWPFSRLQASAHGIEFLFDDGRL